MSDTATGFRPVSDDTRPLPAVGGVLNSIYHGIEHVQVPSTFTSGAAVLQGCLPLFMAETSSEELIRRVGEKKAAQLQQLYRQSTLLNLYYSFELTQVLEALTTAAIPVMVLKGADIAETQYTRPELRHYGDIDLMVHPEDLKATFALLEQLGYHYYQEYRFEPLSRQRAAFVYVKEHDVGYLLFEVHISPHSNEMGIAFDPVQIWQRARSITVASVDVYGMGLEDMFIYLCWHYRSHTFERLLWLYDIAVMLIRCGDQLNWTQVRRLAHELGLLSTVYYCVLLCQQVFQVAIPGYAEIETFKPSVFICRLISHFVGDNLPAILDRTAYRKRKLLQRLMVDNMLMLSLVLFRAAFPHPAHLGRLYMDRSCLPLRLYWLYYPVHLLFILKTGFQTVFSQGRNKA
ncbi:MAG TPA: nucleotidyltransferase family protein [Ktedonobacteraceae bacterium]|nr:nucleotidyltransferase family protein [Ktedonobacteraceae bacterium]